MNTLKWEASSMKWNRRVPHLHQHDYAFWEKDVSSWSWHPPFYWYETDSHFYLEWEIEGLTPDTLECEVQQRTLIIQVSSSESDRAKKGNGAFRSTNSATTSNPASKGRSPLSVRQTDH